MMLTGVDVSMQLAALFVEQRINNVPVRSSLPALDVNFYSLKQGQKVIYS